MIELYKKTICSNCANKSCTNNIKIITTQDLCIEQIYTTTIVKCDDFICKISKRGKKDEKLDKRNGKKLCY